MTSLKAKPEQLLGSSKLHLWMWPYQPLPRYGLILNTKRAQEIEPAIASILSSSTILPFSTAEAEQAAQIRAALKAQGQPIGAYDILIAATALHRNLIMVTANQREFERVLNLQIENWRQAQMSR